MEKADINLFIKYSDALKQEHSPVIHNIFGDFNDMRNMMEMKECSLQRVGNSIFLLVPRHSKFHELQFMSASRKDLSMDLDIFMSEINNDINLRAALIGKEDFVRDLAEIYEKAGFYYGRKIARMRNYNDIKDLSHLIDLLCDGEHFQVEIAREGDAKEIFNLLLEEFDLRSDNIPEIYEIENNIKLKQVFVIRKNDEIIAAHYFTRHNAINYGWYDIIKKEYRPKHLYLHMMKFQYDYSKKLTKVTRSYSWRDINNKRLMALAEKSNQLPDGVYIYNMLFDAPENMEKSHA